MTTHKIQLHVAQHNPSWWGGRILRESPSTHSETDRHTTYTSQWSVEHLCLISWLSLSPEALWLRDLGLPYWEAEGCPSPSVSLTLHPFCSNLAPPVGFTLHTCLQILLTCIESVRRKIPTSLRFHFPHLDMHKNAWWASNSAPWMPLQPLKKHTKRVGRRRRRMWIMWVILFEILDKTKLPNTMFVEVVGRNFGNRNATVSWGVVEWLSST